MSFRPPPAPLTTMAIPFRAADRAASSVQPLDPALEALWTVVGAGSSQRHARREAAGAVSREALRLALLPEEMVVAVKESWARHPELGADGTRREALARLSEVISLCIAEFFRASDQDREIDVHRD